MYFIGFTCPKSSEKFSVLSCKCALIKDSEKNALLISHFLCNIICRIVCLELFQEIISFLLSCVLVVALLYSKTSNYIK